MSAGAVPRAGRVSRGRGAGANQGRGGAARGAGTGAPGAPREARAELRSAAPGTAGMPAGSA